MPTLEIKDDTSPQAAVDWCNELWHSMRNWIESVRPPTGERGRFRWARQVTRPANVGSTSNILGGLRRMRMEDLLTDEDRHQGIAWVQSMFRGEGQYRDAALLDRRPDDWPEGQEWPGSGLLMLNNSRSLMILRCLGAGEMQPSVPPPGIPQAHEMDKLMDYVRSRPLDRDPWGAGSHIMRMGQWVLQWHLEGKVALEPLLDLLRYVYDQQDPRTGLWGDADVSHQVRINGVFKFLPLLCDKLCLPMPYAERIIDQVFAQWERPDYDEHVGACDAWDNCRVVGVLCRQTEHRSNEIRRMALVRLNHTRIFGAPDGGLSYYPGRCATHWCGVDMCEPLWQGDSMGPGLIPAVISCCLDLAGLEADTPWDTDWLPDHHAPKDLCDRIRGELGL